MEENELAALVESERNERDQAARIGRTPRYPLYKHGPIIGVGTISDRGYDEYDDDGLRSAVRAAEADSRTDTLVHVAARRVADDRDTIVCAFEGGCVIPLDEARRIAVNGYATRSGTVVVTTNNCEVVLDAYGFFVRCKAPGCTYVSKYTPAKHIARGWAEAHDEDQPDDGREN